jgi:uncharacterized protein YbbC (DUF1343 family)/CubicO group peptidase (beta-lactamase class C family)
MKRRTLSTRFQFHLLLSILLGLSISPLTTDNASADPPPLDELAALEQAVQHAADESIAAGNMPGCVVLIGRRNETILREAYGLRQVEPTPVPMTVDTVFDMASLTKPIATATSVMILAERGLIDLHSPVANYLPEFGQNGKEAITVIDLLTHQGGLTPDNALSDYDDGPEEAWRRITELELRYPLRSRFAYTDVGFIVLAKLVERVAGVEFNAFTRETLFQPLGMNETGFLPEQSLRERAAPTEKRNDQWMRGEVHDPRAYRLEGVAGHAGLFSTADDLALYARMMLGEGELGGVRVMSRETVQRMTQPYVTPGGLRGLGWDKQSGYSSNRGETFTSLAFGHGGFTGTAFWVDPGRDLFVVFLSSRLHPDGQGSVNRLAGHIGTLAAEAVDSWDVEENAREKAPDPFSPVMTGIDVLQEEEFARLQGRRVGLITNHTGVNINGVTTLSLLHESENVDLVAIFSPEHGIAGLLDTSDIGDGCDPTTGLPIFSLYGERRRPSPESLESIDVLVFDIQDIGARFYTYISTMGYAMEAAAERGIPFFVLDRPNPIGGVQVAGPMRDDERESFTAYHTLPVQHGMTIGELARMFRDERELFSSIQLDLDVVPVRHWRREDLFDKTGLLWINPSPNMRSLTEALLYPGIGLLETTNLSVGRGTDTPFEIVGAPWIDARELAGALNACDLSGVRFVPRRFTPDASVYTDQLCEGINIMITDRETFESVPTGFEIAYQLRRLYPDDWSAERYDRLLTSSVTLDALLEGRTSEEMLGLGHEEMESFLHRREQYLMY